MNPWCRHGPLRWECVPCAEEDEAEEMSNLDDLVIMYIETDQVFAETGFIDAPVPHEISVQKGYDCWREHAVHWWKRHRDRVSDLGGEG